MMQFLNNGLRNIMRKLEYVEIGRSGKYFNGQKKVKIDDMLNMFSGYKANFVKLEKDLFLRVEAVKKIVRNDTVLNFIDTIYGKHRGSKQKEEIQAIVKEELVGKVVMANYGKTNYYRIEDVLFGKPLEEYTF